MTRIVAGSVGGRRIAVPPGSATRPTSDRAREALFSTLEAVHGPLTGARVLDLYAGSGAIGLEALSRGAVHVCLVESDPGAAAVIRANVAALGLAGAVVRHDPVERVVAGEADGAPYDVCVADPPYALPSDRLVAVCRQLADVEHGWLSGGAVMVLERATRSPDWEWPAAFSAIRSRRYGEATLWYGRRS